MRFSYWSDCIRLAYLNKVVPQGYLFAPTHDVKLATYGAFYGAGWGKLRALIDGGVVNAGDTKSPVKLKLVTGDLGSDFPSDVVTCELEELQWLSQGASVSKSPAFTGVRVRVSPWAPQDFSEVLFSLIFKALLTCDVAISHTLSYALGTQAWP